MTRSKPIIESTSSIALALLPDDGPNHQQSYCQPTCAYAHTPRYCGVDRLVGGLAVSSVGCSRSGHRWRQAVGAIGVHLLRPLRCTILRRRQRTVKRRLDGARRRTRTGGRSCPSGALARLCGACRPRAAGAYAARRGCVGRGYRSRRRAGAPPRCSGRREGKAYP